MAEKNIKTRIIHKHDTEENWNKATNFTPKQGEIIVYDVDATHTYERLKIGDGATNVNDLPFERGEVLSALIAPGTNEYNDNPSVVVMPSAGNKSTSEYAYSEGFETTASGAKSHSEGYKTSATGDSSHAEGRETTASNEGSHAEGYQTIAGSKYTHAEGTITTAGAKGYYVWEINVANKTITLAQTIEEAKNTTITPSAFATGYEVGDILTICCNYEYNNFSTITSITDNVITVDVLPLYYSSNYTVYKWSDSATTFINNTIWCSAKSTIGNVDIGIAAHVEGKDNIAYGYTSHVEGYNNIAHGANAHVEGANNIAAYCAHAEGKGCQAVSKYAHAEGRNTIAGSSTTDVGHAEGNNTQALGEASHAEGRNTIVNSSYGHVEGVNCIIEKDAAAGHAEGGTTKVYGLYAHAEGSSTQAIGKGSHAEGEETTASGTASHVEGQGTTASGTGSHAEGQRTTASFDNAHAEGEGTKAIYYSAHAEGQTTTASASGAHAEGKETEATAMYTHAEGVRSKAKNIAAHAEGYQTTANSDYAHAEGRETYTEGIAAHAEGYQARAIGNYSHAEGVRTQAIGAESHVEGADNVANAEWSHVGGDHCNNTVDAKYSFTHGYYLKAKAIHQTVVGRCNADNMDALFIVGNGPKISERSNAFEVISNDEGVAIKVGSSTFTEKQLSGYDSRISANDKRLINLEKGYNDELFVTESSALDVDVPSNALSYAEINKVWGGASNVKSYSFESDPFTTVNLTLDTSALPSTVTVEKLDDGSIKFSGYTEYQGMTPFKFATANLQSQRNYDIYYEVISYVDTGASSYGFNVENEQGTTVDLTEASKTLYSSGGNVSFNFYIGTGGNGAEHLIVKFKARAPENKHPVVHDEYQIPEEVRALDGFFNSNNYIDFDKGVFVRNDSVEEIDIRKYIGYDNFIQVVGGGWVECTELTIDGNVGAGPIEMTFMLKGV